MTQQQPRWECSSKFARTAQPHIADARGARKADVTQVNLYHRRQISVNVEVHLESGVFHAQIDVRALQEKPESSISALRRRDPSETELHYDATCGQAMKVRCCIMFEGKSEGMCRVVDEARCDGALAIGGIASLDAGSCFPNPCVAE